MLVSPARIDPKRKRHAQTQKNQRDRMKAAVELMARTLEARGVDTARTRVRLALLIAVFQADWLTDLQAEVVEAAVEYILSLQTEMDSLVIDTDNPMKS